MGAKPSRPADSSATPRSTSSSSHDGAHETGLDVLTRLAGPITIELDDPFWEHSIANLEYSLNELDADDVHKLIDACCADMIKHTSTSDNLRHLFLTLSSSLETLPISLETAPASLMNQLFLIRVIVAYMMGHIPYVQRITLMTGEYACTTRKEKVVDDVHAIETSNIPFPSTATSSSSRPLITASTSTTSQHHPPSTDIATRLIHALTSAIIDVPMNTGTHDLHVEMITTMLVLVSTQMYVPLGPDYINPYLDRLITSSHRTHHLIHTLMLRYLSRHVIVESERETNVVMVTSSSTTTSTSTQSSLLHKLGSSVKNLLLLPVQVFHYFFPSQPTLHPLADRCALLFLILTHQQHIPNNPFRQAIATFHDSTYHDHTITTSLPISFATLYDTLGTSLPDETATLLLYTLLHGNTSFCEYVYAKSDLDVLVLPLLETLYQQTDLRSNRVYVILIVLLILSQDASFCENVHTRLILKRVPWFHDCILTHISLGSLLMISLFRTVLLNLTSTQRDPYLHTNCLAALANLSTHATQMHPYAAQRLIALLEIISKKYIKLVQQAQRGRAGSTATSSSTSTSTSGDQVTFEEQSDVDELSTFSEFIRLVLEITTSCLTHPTMGISDNIHLLYWLLHQKKLLLPFSTHSRFADLVDTLLSIINYFEQALASENTTETSVERIMSILTRHASKYRSTPSLHIPIPDSISNPTFSYQEQENSDEFFIPYIFQLVHRAAIITWVNEGIVLFDAGATADIDPSQVSITYDEEGNPIVHHQGVTLGEDEEKKLSVAIEKVTIQEDAV